MDGERARLTLAAEGDGPPFEVRLRHFLKWALRRAGLRCVSAELVPPPAPPANNEVKAQEGER